MKALLLKEYRQNHLLPWGGLMVSAALILLAALWMHGYARTQQDQTDLQNTCAMVVLLGNGIIVIVIASGLISSETGTGALTYLLGLPVSRSRIWLAKVLAGLALGAGAVILLTVPISFALPGMAETAGGFLVYLPDLAALGLAIFSVTLLCSTLLSRTLTVLIVAPIVVVCLAAVTILAILLGVAPLQYDGNIADMSLWALALSVPFLFASWVTFGRGELLDSRRRWLLALPSLCAGLVCVSLLMYGAARWQERYVRSGVREVTDVYVSPYGETAAIYVKGNRAPFARDEKRGWSTSGGRLRSRNTVLLDLQTGHELATWSGHRGVAFMPDRQRVTVGSVDAPLRFLRGGPELWDIARGRRLPQRASSNPWRHRAGAAAFYDEPMPWSPDGKWIASLGAQKLIGEGIPSGQVLMTVRADRSQRHLLTIWESGQETPSKSPNQLPIPPDTAISAWAWGTDDTLYLLTKGDEVFRYSPEDGTRALAWRVPNGKGKDGLMWRQSKLSMSPDGRRLVVRVVNVPLPGQPHTSNMRTWVCRVEGAKLIPELVFGDSQNWLAPVWSADSRVLYLGALLRWEVGKQTTSPVRLPKGVGERPLEMAVLPFGHQLVIDDRGKAYVSDEQGLTRPLTEVYPKASASDRIGGVDPQGRLVLIQQEPAGVAILDPRTRAETRIYP